MADIVAADVSAKLLSRTPVYEGTFPGSRNRLVRVIVGITVDPGTNDAYPTGGIPLSSLFTKDDADDTGLDPADTIVQEGPAIMRAAEATLTPAMPAYFYKSAATAASCTLVLLLGAANASAAAHVEHGNSDITAATSFNGDTDPYCELTLVGRLREDVEWTK